MDNSKIDFKKMVVPGLLMLGAGILLYALRPIRIPFYAQPLKDFDIKKYAGEWFEIARLDFKFEKDLKNVTANYLLNDDGSIRVINRGFNAKKQIWQEARGKAKFNGPSDRSALKVSFFGPFYSGYNVVMMSPQYKHALVFGETKDYLWILSRNKTISVPAKKKFLEKALEAGYNIEKLIWTIQDIDDDKNSSKLS